VELSFSYGRAFAGFRCFRAWKGQAANVPASEEGVFSTGSKLNGAARYGQILPPIWRRVA